MFTKEEREKLRVDLGAGPGTIENPSGYRELAIALLDDLDAVERALATAREDASEMEKKAIAEGSEALALRAEVAALKAATQWRKMEDAPRNGTEILIWVLARHYELAVWEGHSCNQWVGDASRYDEDQVSAWLPIPAPPSGDGQ